MAKYTTKVRRNYIIKEPAASSTFSPAIFEKFVEDLKTDRLPLKKVTLSDPIQIGLKAIIRESGVVSFHVQYEVGTSRPMLKLGEYPAMSVNEARKIAKTVRTLGDRGIDVQEGLHERLVRELLEQGEKWRP